MPRKRPAPENIKQERFTATRLLKLRQLCRAESIHVLLITDPVDAAYISGFISSNVTLIIGPRKNHLITDFRYETAARRFCSANPAWSYQPSALSTTETVAALLSPGRRCGFQADRMTVDEFTRLKRTCRSVKFIGCSKLIESALLEKNASEIETMAAAARIGDAAFSRLLDDIRPGVTERTLADYLENYCRELGSEKPSFDTIVLGGAHSAEPHGKPGNYRLRRGDYVLIDFGCMVNGFCSDMTRTVVLGKATAQHRHVYQTVLDAQRFACENARSGMPAKVIDALARDHITKAGFGEQFGHALGHGVGRRIHESPRISAQIATPVPENSVITIEPGIYIPGFGGVRIEDMTVLTSHGAHPLTITPRELLNL